MRRYVVLLFLVCVSGCNGPGLRHLGVAPVPVREGNMQFDIRSRGGLAEAIRTNAIWGVRMRDVVAHGRRAITRATGCEVAWLRGDPAVLLAGLDCGDGRPVPPPPRHRTVCHGTVLAPARSGESDVILSCG